MFRIRSAFRALKRRWIISILVLVQFTFGLSTITGTVNIFANLSYLKNNSILDLNYTYLIEPDNRVREMDEKKYDKEQIEGIYQALERHKDVISLGTYYEDNIILDTTAPLDNKLIDGLSNSFLGMNEPIIHAIVIDKNYYNLLDLDLPNGHGITPQDFEKNDHEEINVLVGSFFEKYYSIGDLINNQYRINGFLPDKYIVNNNTSNTYLKLNKAMLIPMSKDRYTDYRSMFGRLHLGTVLKLEERADIKQLNQLIQLDKTPVTLSFKSLGDEIRRTIKESTYSEIPQTMLGLTFMLFSVVGIVVTTIVSIMIRKREFGIKLALGERPLGILTQITIENVIIGVAGLVLALIHFKWRYRGILQMSSEINKASPLDIKLNDSIMFFIFMIFMLILLVASIFIYLYIRKQELKSLIGGME